MISKEKMEMKKYYDKGLELYRAANFSEAIKYFKKCMEIVPGDGPSEVYVHRCEDYIKNPPPAGWDGVYNMKTK